ncbi:MAG: hypothetical protein KGD68_14060, partial [Candidatus Lokiarchaeota archaeon]|nr:hypothetical protein [Candidatus Lokiarchaeota archaeon]
MKKTKNRLISIFLLFLLCYSIFTFDNSVKNCASNSIIQETDSPKLSNPDKSLLHSYDFEDETIGQDPSGVTLVVSEPTGCTANIETLGDGQQKHVALYKSGSVGRVMLRDNISYYYGQNYDVGELNFKFYHDTSLFGIWFIDSGGILFRLDFWSGNVGQWAISNIITSYTSNQWTNITIYYNISHGWMFDIDSVRYGGDYGYSFEHGGSSGITHIEWVSAISGGGDGYFRIDDLSFYDETEHLINIMTPENKTYTGPISGYYPATYGFEDVLDDTTPTYCEYDAIGTTPDWVNSYTRVINNKIDGVGNKHNKVLLLKDASSSSVCISNFNFTEYRSEIARNSAFEFYHCLNPTGQHYLSRIVLSGNFGTLAQILFDTNALEIEYANSTGQYSTGLYLERDKWYRYSIDISCDGGYAGLSANQFRFRIYDDENILLYSSYDMNFPSS